jgi:hypothetical protein
MHLVLRTTDTTAPSGSDFGGGDAALDPAWFASPDAFGLSGGNGNGRDGNVDADGNGDDDDDDGGSGNRNGGDGDGDGDVDVEAGLGAAALPAAVGVGVVGGVDGVGVGDGDDAMAGAQRALVVFNNGNRVRLFALFALLMIIFLPNAPSPLLVSLVSVVCGAAGLVGVRDYSVRHIAVFALYLLARIGLTAYAMVDSITGGGGGGGAKANHNGPLKHVDKRREMDAMEIDTLILFLYVMIHAHWFSVVSRFLKGLVTLSTNERVMLFAIRARAGELRTANLNQFLAQAREQRS